MTEQAELFFIQYIIRREELLLVVDALEEALAEDHRVNADMFDTTRLNFSDNPHANTTMRALEARLAEKDILFLNVLDALLAVGTDLVLSLADFESPMDFLEAVAEEFTRREERGRESVYLAAQITAVKAEHQLKRLIAAMEQMKRIVS